MRDYNYVVEGISTTPVARMRTEDILRILSGAIVVSFEDGESDSEEAVRERLRLELFIRERGLRPGVS